MAESRAENTVLIDNGRVRVQEWRFAPGTETGHHRHARDYVVVPTAGGALTSIEEGGERVFTITAGEPYFREAGMEHNVVNRDSREIAFIEIEIK